jgi:hypothetical protein
MFTFKDINPGALISVKGEYGIWFDTLDNSNCFLKGNNFFVISKIHDNKSEEINVIIINPEYGIGILYLSDDISFMIG